MADDKGGSVSTRETEMKEDSASPSANISPTSSARKRKGIMSRLWSGIFRQSDDFEKRLQHISKEEAAALARLKKRSISWRSMTRNLIVFSVVLEAIAVGYAIMTTRTLDMDWRMRAFRVLPMFVLPALSAIAYSALLSFIKMCDRKDQKTLERLRAERQEKIDELKERTNYYTTQQLIQRYDPDPAAKAAAATVLASKLGADSGLTMYFGDDHKDKDNASTGKGRDSERAQPGGLRNRKQYTRSNSTGSAPLPKQDDQRPRAVGPEGPQLSEHKDMVVDHYTPQGSSSYDGGWLARFAALLVGEDPTQSYALICGNCHMHNGLARKEDFPYITYYCPHCHALNQAKQSSELISRTSSHLVSGTATPDTIISSTRGGGVTGDVANVAGRPIIDSKLIGDVADVASGPIIDSKLTDDVANVASRPIIDSKLSGDVANIDSGPIIDSDLSGDIPLKAGSEIEEVGEKVLAEDDSEQQ